MNILALDLSLTATGWARYAHDALHHSVITSDGLRGYERLAHIRGLVLSVAAPCDLVVIEGYSYHSKGRAILDAAELGGVIRMALRDLGYRWVDVPPAVVKKYATGRGNAPKDAVLVEAVKRLGYAGSSHDEADALWLLEMALDRYGVAELRVPKAHREALAKVEWPEITATMEA